VPDISLKSRKLPWVKARELIQSQFCNAKKLQEEWLGNTTLHKNLIKELKDKELKGLNFHGENG